jgi:hypothetical protein
VKKLKVKKKKKIPAPHGRCCLKKKRISRWWLMIILSLFFSYRSWVLFPPLGEICTSLKTQPTHKQQPPPPHAGARCWVMNRPGMQEQKTKKKRRKQLSLLLFTSSLLRAWNNITQRKKKKNSSPGLMQTLSSIPLLLYINLGIPVFDWQQQSPRERGENPNFGIDWSPPENLVPLPPLSGQYNHKFVHNPRL